MIQKRIPSVRFIEYSDEWAKTKLKKIAEIIGGGTPDTKQLSYWNGGINWFSPTEVGKTVYLTKSEKTISQLGLQKSSAKLLPAFKTILFTSRAGIGDVGILTEEAATNQGFQSLVVNEETDVYFLYSYSDKIKKYALKHSAGSTFLEISGKELGKMDLSVPSFPEQSAIGSLFRTLDDLLAGYKNNLANYQSLKVTMLSKMFPKAGQTVPEIRLDGFEGEWKFSSLGEQADITKLAGFEFTNHVVYSDEGQIPAIRGLNVKNQKVNLSDVKYIDKSDFSKLDRSKLIEDDLLFTYVGTVGEVARVPESVLWYLAPNVSRLRLNSALDSRFVLYQMASNRFKQKQIFPLIATSSQPALSMANIRKFIISFTTLEEQQAIGLYFSNLDNLIAAHQEKISQLEILKKKLLQDMFI